MTQPPTHSQGDQPALPAGGGPPAPAAAPATVTWPFVTGAVLVGLGLLCAWRVFVGPGENPFLVGILLVVGGLSEGLHAILDRSWRQFATELAPALRFVIAGRVVVTDPQTGSFALTLIVAAALVTGAVYRLVSAFRDQPLGSFATLGVAAGVSVAAWMVLLWTWPRSGFIVLGSVAAAVLLFTGAAWIRLGMAQREAGTKG
ncbi:MAG: HdeD family acid-resistance protein [Alsobacter sp.]